MRGISLVLALTLVLGIGAEGIAVHLLYAQQAPDPRVAHRRELLHRVACVAKDRAAPRPDQLAQSAEAMGLDHGLATRVGDALNSADRADERRQLRDGAALAAAQ